MVADALMGLLLGLLEPLLGTLPTIDLTTFLVASDVGRYLRYADTIVPVLEPLRWLAVFLGWGMLFIPVALFVFIWKLLPGKMT